jgi:hypothetical protein
MTPHRSPRLLAVVAASALLVSTIVLLPSPGPSAGAEPAPPAVGWRAVSSTVDRGGIEIIELRRDDPLTRAQVAIVPRSQLARLRPVLADDQLVGGTGRLLTTSMCARLHCHAAVNGDRHVLSGHDAGRPVGAVAVEGDLIATQPLPPEDPYAHLLIGRDGSLDGTIQFPLPVTPEVASGDVVLPVAVNRQPSGDQISILDERYNPQTRTHAGTVEYVLETFGSTDAGRLLSPALRREGSGPIPADGMVVAAHGPTAIAAAEAWWAAAGEVGSAIYSSGIGGVRDIVGGSPLLLDNSQYGFPTDRGDGRQPRTIIGWDANRILLVAVDGRLTDWSVGVTLVEAAQLMRWLGATDALNLDGGSSTTFVDHGRLANRPSAGVQVSAVQALVVMPPENRIGTPPPPRSLDAACPPGRVPSAPFVDIAGNVHEAAITCMAWWRVTTGTSAATYSPNRHVRRDQMASFLARMLYVSGVPFPTDAPDAFPDDGDSVHEPFVDAMAALGVIGGRADGTYGPSGIVTRGQMATFLARAMPLATRTTLANTTDYFADDSGHTHELGINQITEALVSGGTADGGYAPGGLVRRDQMASFLARVLAAVVEQGRSAPPG